MGGGHSRTRRDAGGLAKEWPGREIEGGGARSKFGKKVGEAAVAPRGVEGEEGGGSKGEASLLKREKGAVRHGGMQEAR